MNYGAKATNLMKLRDVYPDHVPAFETVPFSEIIRSYNATVRRVNNLIAVALEQDMPVHRLEKRISTISKSVTIDTAALSVYRKKVIAQGWKNISVRTSALLEDGSEHSFAGQYVSFVDVTSTKKSLEKYVRECFCSLFSVRVIQYAKTHRLSNFSIDGSVIIQKMFYGQKSGVLFTENGQGQMTFAVADSWRNEAVEGRDTATVNISKTTLAGSGSTQQLKKLATIGIELERRYGRSLDIEWAYDRRSVMLLQMRPQTTSTTSYTLTWDGTNISENYPGVTLPLTYSFIKNLYAHVYPSFFRLMGMSEKKLVQNDWIFNNALGYIDGRVYYRIENWYELVRLIPGSRNQEFFEAMLNPAKKRASSHTSPKTAALLSPSFWLLTLRFVWLLSRSDAHSRSFSKKFTTKYMQYNRLNWSSMTAEATLDQIRGIREELLVLWGVPILNDFRVMIFHGIFATVLLKNEPRAMYLNHLKGLTDRASVKPLQALYALGKEIDQAMKREKIRRIEKLPETPSWDKVSRDVQNFIDIFGGRTPDELQLENPRLSENVWNIIHLAYASKDSDLSVVSSSNSSDFHSFPAHKRLFARFIVHNVRQAIDYRERFRFNRAQVFGIARTAYLALGEKLVLAHVIDQQEDIFLMTEQEIEAIVRGHSWSYDMRRTIVQRKREHKQFSKKPFFVRVAGNGVVAPAATADATPTHTSGSSVAGVGVAAGIVTAPVIVVHNFDPELDVVGKILVVKHVDPGWTLLLLQAAGVITEQGNPLSHVAIVAREISIPAIVDVKNAVRNFKTGQVLTMDGTNGEVTREA